MSFWPLRGRADPRPPPGLAVPTSSARPRVGPAVPGMTLHMSLLRGWTAADIPDLTGRRAVVTGASSGLGLETARMLAARGAEVVMTSRDPVRGEQAVRRVLADVPHARRATGRARPRRPGLGARARGGAGGRAAGPAGQQRGSHGGPAPAHRRRLRAADGDQPPRALRAHRPAAAGPAGPARSAGGDGEQLPALVRLAGPRRPDERAVLRPVAGLLGLEAGEPAVRPRARLPGPAGRAPTWSAWARTPATPGPTWWQPDRRPVGRVTGAVLRAGSALVGQSARIGALPQLRAATDPDVRGGDYYGPRGPGEQRGLPRRRRTGANARDDRAARPALGGVRAAHRRDVRGSRWCQPGSRGRAEAGSPAPITGPRPV